VCIYVLCSYVEIRYVRIRGSDININATKVGYNEVAIMMRPPENVSRCGLKRERLLDNRLLRSRCGQDCGKQESGHFHASGSKREPMGTKECHSSSPSIDSPHTGRASSGAQPPCIIHNAVMLPLPRRLRIMVVV